MRSTRVIGIDDGSGQESSVTYVFLGLLILSLCVNIGAALILRGRVTVERLDLDEAEYLELSRRVYAGEYELYPRRVIGHPLVLAGLRSLVGTDVLAIQLGVSALFSLTAPLAYLLARRTLREERAGVTAGLGVALWPLFIWYGATLYSDGLALLLFTAFLVAMPGPEPPGHVRRGRWLLSGMLLGMCMHYRPMYLMYSPFAALIAVGRRPFVRAAVARVALLTAGCLLLVLPWSVILSLRTGTPVLLCSQGGETIAGGLNPELLRIERERGFKPVSAPDGRVTWVGPGKWLTPESTGYVNDQELRLPYSQMSDLLTRRCLSWVRSHPRESLYLTLRKFLYMWGIYPIWNGCSQTLLGNVPILALLVLAVASLFRLRQHLGALVVLWTLPLFVMITAAVGWGSWRFREPGDLGLILIAAALPFAARVESALARLRPPP